MDTAPQDAEPVSTEQDPSGDPLPSPEWDDGRDEPVAESVSVPGMDRAAQLRALRDQVRRMERGGGSGRQQVLPFGVDELDDAFPEGGLPLGCLHEMVGNDPGTPTAFAAVLLARLAERRPGAPVLWILRGRDLHAAGLVPYGLTPDRLLALRTERQEDALWAMEEALRCGALSGVLAELDSIDMIASRRLQLAAESSGVTGFLLGGFLEGGGRGRARQKAGGLGGSSVAVTRWRIGPAPSRPVPLGGGAVGLGEPRWRIALERCRGGRPGEWLLEWNDGALIIPDDVPASDLAADGEEAMPWKGENVLGMGNFGGNSKSLSRK